MKWILVVALVASLGANAWLLAAGTSNDSGTEFGPGLKTRADGGERNLRGLAAAARSSAEPLAPTHPQALQARVAELERDLAVAQEKAELADSVDPLALIIYSNKPLAWKARQLLEIEPEEERSKAARKLAREMREHEGSAIELLEVLSTESDPDVINILGTLIRAGAAAKARPEDRRAFGELVRNAAMAEVRAAAVRGAYMGNQIRGRADEETQALAAEMNALLVEAIADDTSPEVVGAIADAVGSSRPPQDVVEALRGAAGRLPASDGRRSVWKAIARGRFIQDKGAQLAQEFDNATDQSVRNDIAAGIARAANSMSSCSRGTPEEIQKQVHEAQARFHAVYEGTTDADVRRRLCRAAIYGLDCIQKYPRTESLGAEAGWFFREIAAAEPDDVLRERILKVAAAFETDGMGAYNVYDKIMAGGN